MIRTFLYGKIHKATVTDARVEYEGSCEIDISLLNACGIKPYEKIDLYNDFESIAGLLCNLDLFITVSNSTAHLAGALGVKTLLIKPFNHATFHYWNQPSDRTPWYDSLKIFSSYNNFENAITNIQKEIVRKFNY